MKSPIIDPAHFREQLRSLGELQADSVGGFFGPRSMTWRVNREAVLYLGGMRALLLQLAHPKVAQGVADHSRFREQGLARALRTFHSIQQMTFGTREEALRTAVTVHAVHRTVKGQRPEHDLSVRDREYRATDPELLTWVYATLVDSAILTHDTFLPPLAPAEWEQFYQESKRFAALFGIEERWLPERLSDFHRWMEGQVASERLAVSPTARELARALLVGSWFAVLMAPLNYVLAAGLLPPRFRMAYGLRWNLPVRLAYRGLVALGRAVVPRLPRALRSVPAARRAERRCRCSPEKS